MGVGKPVGTTVVSEGEGMHFTMVQSVPEHKHPESPLKALSNIGPQICCL